MLHTLDTPINCEQEVWDSLPTELRFKLTRQAQRRTQLTRLFTQALLLPPLLYVGLPPAQWLVNKAVPSSSDLIKLAGKPDTLQFLDTSEPKLGDIIAGFEVNSEYGMRPHPIDGDIRMHRGVDVKTPIGTPLKAPANQDETVTVNCWPDPNGGGLVAEIDSRSIPDYRFKALHLGSCMDGVYDAGEVFASTGESGKVTGPHLDFMQLPKHGDRTVPPQTGYIEWLLTGVPLSGIPEGLKPLIKQEEGYRAQAYLDPVGVPTIGYGSTQYPDGSAVQLGDAITREGAEKLLDHDIRKFNAAVERAVTVPLDRHEKEALTSFAYNVGTAALQNSTLVAKLNKGDRRGAAAEFDRWVYGDGVVLPGLVKRRAKEKALFLQ